MKKNAQLTRKISKNMNDEKETRNENNEKNK
jgi:hypothetical protein